MSSDQRLSPDIKEFIRRYVPSIAVIDVLFLFYLQPEKNWSHDEISRELRTNVTATDFNLSFLSFHGFIKPDGAGYIYRQDDEKLQCQVAQLYGMYRERPVAVVTQIYEKPSDALKGFADAFKLKKD